MVNGHTFVRFNFGTLPLADKYWGNLSKNKSITITLLGRIQGCPVLNEGSIALHQKDIQSLNEVTFLTFSMTIDLCGLREEAEKGGKD